MGGPLLTGRTGEGGLRGEAAAQRSAAQRAASRCRASQHPHTRPLLPHTCLQAAFGPFYRITQLILTTTPAANSSITTPSGLPSIVTGGWHDAMGGGPQQPELSPSTAQHLHHHPLPLPADAHIRLLFDMQAEIDALVANPDGGDGGDRSSSRGSNSGGGGSWNITLGDVCLKPLGGACATQSVLQYWGMSRDTFEHGGHGWSDRGAGRHCWVGANCPHCPRRAPPRWPAASRLVE